jgi:hypothetical protein
MFASATAAHASTAAPDHASLDRTPAVQQHAIVTPHSSDRIPSDSTDVCLEEDDDKDDDEDSTHSRAGSMSHHLDAGETLQLRGASHASRDSLSPDGRTAATQFLTDVVRRM